MNREVHYKSTVKIYNSVFKKVENEKIVFRLIFYTVYVYQN